MPNDIKLIVFIEGVVIISTQTVSVLLEESLEETFELINDWMSAYGLVLTADKTGSLVITKRRVHNKITVTCLGHTIRSKKSLRYLSVQIYVKMGIAKYADLTSVRTVVTAR